MLIANYVAVTGNSEAAYELLHVDAGREGKETVGSLSLAYQHTSRMAPNHIYSIQKYMI